MNPKRWHEVRELLDAVLEAEPPERDELLKAAGERDPNLRLEVEELLASQADMGTFLDRAPFGEWTGMEDFVGRRLGPYRIVQLIGHGGMGGVYLAERDDAEFHKQVAIKVIRREAITMEALARFRSERQILAGLEHPNIARLLDGGTEGGLPYLVLEHVEGEPLDKYCERLGLSVPQRVELFLAVCSAVQCAHQSLIVHRDLKPGNILVTADGVPKLLDFGIAKLLEPSRFPHSFGPETQMGMQWMTPEYASPEQVRQTGITTLSDVYSLGVVLYQLVTGHLPYEVQGKSVQEIQHQVCEVVPEPPSVVVRRRGAPGSRQLSRALAGDLDAILNVALQKRTEQRYSSVQALMDDLRSHLAGRSVLARRESAFVRARKFVRRHRTGVAAALLVVLFLCGAVVGTTWQARVAREQRDLAVRAATAMVYELAEGMRRMTGPTQSRLGLLIQAEAIFSKISEGDLATPNLRLLDADTRRVLSQTFMTLGEPRRALVHSEEAVRRARRLASAPHSSIEERSTLAAAIAQHGDVLANLQKTGLAEAAYDEAIAIAESVARDREARPTMLSQLALLLQRKADRLWNTDLKESEKLYRKSYEINRRLVTRFPADLAIIMRHSIDLERLGDIEYARGRVNESCAKYREVLHLRRRLRAQAMEPFMTQGLALSMQYVAWCEDQEKHIDAAAALYRESIALQKGLVASDPNNVVFFSNLIGGLVSLGGVYITAERPAEAIPPIREALEGARSLSRKGEKWKGEKKVAEISMTLAQALSQDGQYVEAKILVIDSIRILRKLMNGGSDDLDVQRSLGYALLTRGDLDRRQGRPILALPIHREACELRQAIAAVSRSSLDSQLLAGCYLEIGRDLVALGDRSQARGALSQGLDILQELRQKGQLSPAAEGARVFLPEIETLLNNIAE